jgi:hypothetical protein
VTVRACPFCSEQIHPNAVKCVHCGEPLPPPPAAKKSRGQDEDLSAVLGWTFEDPNWIAKVGIGTVCIIFGGLIIPFFILEGYKLRIARQQLRAPGATPMPEFDDLGELILDGLKMFCNMLVISFGFVLAAAILVGGGAALDMAVSGQVGPFLALAVVLCYAGLIFGSLGFAFLIPAIEIEFLETGSPLSVLHVRSMWRRISKRPGDYFIMFAYHFLASLIGQFLQFLLCAPLAWAFFTQGCIVGRFLAQQRVKDGAKELDDPAPKDWS